MLSKCMVENIIRQRKTRNLHNILDTFRIQHHFLSQPNSCQKYLHFQGNCPYSFPPIARRFTVFIYVLWSISKPPWNQSYFLEYLQKILASWHRWRKIWGNSNVFGYHYRLKPRQHSSVCFTIWPVISAITLFQYLYISASHNWSLNILIFKKSYLPVILQL